MQWSEVPDGYSKTNNENYCQINSYGRMSTWTLDTDNDSYSLKIEQYDPCKSALQLGFCGDGFKVPETIFTCSKKFCGTIFYGSGDDKTKDSVSYDPVRRLSWFGDKEGVHNTQNICEGDMIHVVRKKDVVRFYKNDQERELCSLFIPDFNNPKPCLSVYGNITVNLYHESKKQQNTQAVYQQTRF